MISSQVYRPLIYLGHQLHDTMQKPTFSVLIFWVVYSVMLGEPSCTNYLFEALGGILCLAIFCDFS